MTQTLIKVESTLQGLRNVLIMEHICSFLTGADLCNWYSVIHFLQVDMDRICWLGHVKRLATVLNKKIDKKVKYHKQFHQLSRKIERCQEVLKTEFQGFPNDQHIMAAARLAFYNMPAETPTIRLNYYPVLVPIEHIWALMTQATNCIELKLYQGERVGNILDNIDTAGLMISHIKLPDEDYQTLASIMRTRVHQLHLNGFHWPTYKSMSSLLQYDGRGRCHLITLEGVSRDWNEVCEHKASLEQWCAKVNWKTSLWETNRVHLGLNIIHHFYNDLPLLGPQQAHWDFFKIRVKLVYKECPIALF